MKKTGTSRKPEVLLRHVVFCAEPLQRPNYFAGRLITERDFTSEQNYFLGKQRQHNKHCHGLGVVSGLKISIANEGTSGTITIGPGVAIDPEGNEVHLCTPVRLPLLEPPTTAIQVGIHFLERFAGSIPRADVSDQPNVMPARVEEGCEIVLEALPLSQGSLAKHCSGGDKVLPLARIVQRGRKWRLDARFKVPRAH